MSAPTTSRPTFAERTDYIGSTLQERFIVPLLKQAIDAALAQHAKPGARALDAGCGGQPFRETIQSLGMIYSAMDVVAQPGMTTDFICPIDGALPDNLLRAPPFDLILCTEVMEHVADWPAAWANLARLLAPGGVLILTCPFFYPLHEEPYDFFRPTLHAIKYWSERSGLQQLELRKLGTPWDVVGTSLAANGPAPATSGLTSKLVTSIIRKVRKSVCKMLQKRTFQRYMTVRDTQYLANFAVLTKPSEPPR